MNRSSMMIRRAFVLAALPAVTAAAQYAPVWSVPFGTSTDDMIGYMVGDGEGGVYVGGGTWHGSLLGPSAGGLDSVLLRMGPDGTVAWAQQFGIAGDDHLNWIARDPSGGLLLAGNSWGDILAPIGTPVVNKWDAWLRRVAPDGTIGWTLQIVTTANDYARFIMPDGVGGFYVAGATSGLLGSTKYGTYDGFVRRYDSAGAVLWTYQLGDIGWTSLQRGVLTASGVVFAGDADGSVGGTSAGGRDVWLVSLDGAGNEQWRTQFGSADDDFPADLVPDGAGGFVFSASVRGAIGGPHAGQADSLVAQYGADGTQAWATQFGSTENDVPTSLLLEGTGTIVVAGYTRGILGASNLGEADVYIARMNASGTVLGFDQLGSAGIDNFPELVPHPAGGYYTPVITNGDFGGAGAGGYDSVICRLDVVPPGPCYADCDGNGALNVFDYICFGNAYAAGCP